MVFTHVVVAFDFSPQSLSMPLQNLNIFKFIRIGISLDYGILLLLYEFL
jgi:hypothetical protein